MGNVTLVEDLLMKICNLRTELLDINDFIMLSELFRFVIRHIFTNFNYNAGF